MPAPEHFNIRRKTVSLCWKIWDSYQEKQMLNGCNKINQKLLYLADHKSKEQQKTRRRFIHVSKKVKQDKNKKKNGTQYKTLTF